MITRRRTILGMGAVAAGAAAPWLWRRAADGDARAVFFSAVDDEAGRHYIAALAADGRELVRAEVEDRAHSVAVAPDGASAMFFARRPGRLAWQLDLAAGGIARTWEAVPGRHFYGHGAFSPDGRLLYASENDYDNARGAIGVYDMAAGRRIAELPSHGIGPHDVRLLPDGRTLAVANGGIRTHPDSPREALNLDTMRPSLVYLDREDGTLLERVRPPHHQLSVRHLWVTRDARVGVAMQYQGPVTDRVPLVGFHRRGEALRTALAPLAEQRGMRGYTASICIHAGSGTAAVTCPRGDLVTFWDVDRAEFRGARRLRDPGGANLAPDGEGFVITTGTGQLARLAPDGHTRRVVTAERRHWDNHLVGRLG